MSTSFPQPLHSARLTSDARVVVAMSGGVDSSVAALALHEAGFSVVGVSMQVWDYRAHGGSCTRATCCAPDDFTDARKVAARIGVPYYVVDFEDLFREQVIDKFIASYQQGLTPNPCVDCNNKVKFRELRDRAKKFGGTHVATGHYACIEERTDGFHLLRGRDPLKDQSYFLYGLKQSELAETLFPVGHLTKDEVREYARRAGLVTAEKPESQDICFVSGKVEDFLRARGGAAPAGKIVNRQGRILGTHDGVHHFTVGQRRGIRIGGVENPLYVLELDAADNLVVVGTRDELEQGSFLVRDVTWCAPQVETLRGGASDGEMECLVQVRYRHHAIPVRVRANAEGAQTVKVTFVDQWSAVSPGQAAVFYDASNREVLGGGTIAQSARAIQARSAHEGQRMLAVVP